MFKVNPSKIIEILTHRKFRGLVVFMGLGVGFRVFLFSLFTWMYMACIKGELYYKVLLFHYVLCIMILTALCITDHRLFIFVLLTISSLL